MFGRLDDRLTKCRRAHFLLSARPKEVKLRRKNSTIRITNGENKNVDLSFWCRNVGTSRRHAAAARPSLAAITATATMIDRA